MTIQAYCLALRAESLLIKDLFTWGKILIISDSLIPRYIREVYKIEIHLSRFILNDLVFFHKIFYRYCPVAFPDYLKVAVQEDLSDDRLRSRIVPPDYLGAPIRNEFEDLRASKLDLFSMICTIDIEKQVFRHSFFVRSHFMWNRLRTTIH